MRAHEKGEPGSEVVARAAGSAVLLVACDFDGTLSPLAATPGEARAEARALAALRGLARLPRTYAAVVSGRGLAELRGLTAGGGEPGEVHLIGSHGAESDFWSSRLDDEEMERVRVLRAEVGRIAAGFPGALMEEKPLGAALHVRQCREEDAARARAAALEGPGKLAGVHVLEGHAVLELSARPYDKGSALVTLRYRLGASRAVFIGDDRTDEAAFALMGGDDVSVRVGKAATSALFCVESQGAVAPLLEAILAARRGALEREWAVPITAHALLSDQRTVALVDHFGTVCWMCLPRADSGAVFASLLGDRGGRFRVAPKGRVDAGVQGYVEGTMIARTRWGDGGGAGEMTLTDYLDASGGRAYQRAGRSDLVRVLEGPGVWEIAFEPGPDFGRGRAAITVIEGGLRVECGADISVLLGAGVSWEIRPTAHGDAAYAMADTRGGAAVLEWRWGAGGVGANVVPEASRRAQTERFWSGWASSLTLPGVAPGAVKRSALVLKGLCHGPSGAMLAAATTSLPEQLGGVRNWDYRFCWPRDACLSARALLRLGNAGVAMKLLDWLVEVVASAPSPDRLRPIYTVSGENLWPEAEIGALTGYHRSGPVRVGNAADGQVQLDVFGPIVELVAALSEQGTPVTPEHWRLVQSMVEAVELRWRESDHGIWEVRGPKQRHVHSAVMCWVAARRGAQLAREVMGQSRPAWEALAEEIRREVLERGYNDRLGAFAGTFGGEHLDAAALWVVLSGMLGGDDARAVSTVRAIERGLRRGAVVDRYRFDDGLPGREGGFVILSFWLAEALWIIGDRGAARELFDAAAGLSGPTGLLAEQFEPEIGLALGNYPQAYSHLGLIDAAVRIAGG